MLEEAGLLVPVDGGVGPGLDCAVVPTKHAGLVLVSTIDFFYPLVLDPYMQVAPSTHPRPPTVNPARTSRESRVPPGLSKCLRGATLQGKIGCANVLSDLYAMGVYDCDNMLMVLAASQDMAPEHRKIVTGEMIRGFSDLAKEGQ